MLSFYFLDDRLVHLAWAQEEGMDVCVCHSCVLQSYDECCSRGSWGAVNTACHPQVGARPKQCAESPWAGSLSFLPVSRDSPEEGGIFLTHLAQGFSLAFSFLFRAQHVGSWVHSVSAIVCDDFICDTRPRYSKLFI